MTLSGGGAFGAAHAGVLSVLEERGIRPGNVTGTSSGALVGSAFAAGLDSAAIEDITRRFRAVTLTKGPLSTALRASIAVPGLLPPVRTDGRLLADGGMIDNVPHAAAKELGAERVIVVHLHAKWENVRMMRTITQTAELARDPNVVLVQPEMERMAQWTMRDVGRLIDEGRRAANVALDATDMAL